jgi:hypothetical protein
MPRYFFHLSGSGARDVEGQDFPDDEAAREEARLAARELSENSRVSKTEHIVVTDIDGNGIHEEPLTRR